MQHPSVTTVSGPPALLALVEQRWLDQAAAEFQAGKDVIYFGTNSIAVAPTSRLPVKAVYFKPHGRNEVTMHAEFVALSTGNIPESRLRGTENQHWKYYYGFRHLTPLASPVPVTDLRHQRTKKSLRNDVAGSRVIIDPKT